MTICAGRRCRSRCPQGPSARSPLPAFPWAPARIRPAHQPGSTSAHPARVRRLARLGVCPLPRRPGPLPRGPGPLPRGSGPLPRGSGPNPPAHPARVHLRSPPKSAGSLGSRLPAPSRCPPRPSRSPGPSPSRSPGAWALGDRRTPATTPRAGRLGHRVPPQRPDEAPTPLPGSATWLLCALLSGSCSVTGPSIPGRRPRPIQCLHRVTRSKVSRRGNVVS